MNPFIANIFRPSVVSFSSFYSMFLEVVCVVTIRVKILCGYERERKRGKRGRGERNEVEARPAVHPQFGLMVTFHNTATLGRGATVVYKAK